MRRGMRRRRNPANWRRSRATVYAALLVLGLLMAGGCGSGTVTSASPTSPPTLPVSTTTTAEAPLTTIATAATTTLPSLILPEVGREIVALSTSEKVVALTFDGAYEEQSLPAILRILREEAVPATFFLTGEFVESFPESVRLILDDGHPLGSHSYSHPDFTTVSDDRIREELRRTERLFEDAGADDPRPLFRPPYGARNAHVLRLLAAEGYLSVYWTIDTIDWREDRTVAQIQGVVAEKVKPGAIVLMHIGGSKTVEALPGMIEELKTRGYRFVDLRDMDVTGP